MVYGAAPIIGTTAADFALEPVMTFSSKVIALHELKDGDTVGYGSTWRARGTRHIAVVAAGYGDGYPRHARNGTPVLVNSQRAPLAGRISMDMLTVDVTELATVSCGDPVTLWGHDLPVEQIAECAGTIAYELLCGVTSRVRRVWVD
jgi:alanine racemase